MPSSLRIVEAARDGDPPRGPMAPAMTMTAGELAAELRVSVKTVRRLDQSGRLPRGIKIGHARRWPRQTIIDWLAVGAPDRETWEFYGAARPRKR